MADIHNKLVDEDSYQGRAAPVMPALLAACPSFADAWRAHQAEWPILDGSYVYLDVAAFADHMAAKLKAGETDEFPAVFAAAERLLEEEDHVITEVVGVGLFEDMQGSAHRLGDRWLSARFRPWLGPRSIKLWDSVSQFNYGTTDEPSVLAARAVAAHLSSNAARSWSWSSSGPCSASWSCWLSGGVADMLTSLADTNALVHGSLTLLQADALHMALLTHSM